MPEDQRMKSIFENCSELMFKSETLVKENLEHQDYDIISAGFHEYGWTVVLRPNAAPTFVFMFESQPFSPWIEMTILKKVLRTDHNIKFNK